MESPINATKPYLDYLEKEMLIQGILSAFCVVAAAGVFDRAINTGAGPSAFLRNLQANGTAYLIAGSVALLGAAVMFYLQRSDLAEFYGQITLSTLRLFRDMTIPEDSYNLPECVSRADSWTLWNRYKMGLAFLVLAGAEFGLALVIQSDINACAFGCSGGLRPPPSIGDRRYNPGAQRAPLRAMRRTLCRPV